MSNNPYSHTAEISPPAPQPSSWAAKLGVLFGVCVILLVLVLLLIPIRRSASGPVMRMSCAQNLRQIGLALHNYHDQYGEFSVATIADTNGKPLHSWRALILPFVEHQATYDQIDWSCPWNEQTEQIQNRSIACYRCPSYNGSPGFTSYLAVTDDAGEWLLADVQKKNVAEDGSVHNTFQHRIVVVEVPTALAVPWSKPADITMSGLRELLTNDTLNHEGGFSALMSDGEVRFISSSTTQSELDSLINGTDVESPE